MITDQHDVEGERSLSMKGLFHEITFMEAITKYDPILIEIRRGPNSETALMDQEDIDALWEFLDGFRTKE